MVEPNYNNSDIYEILSNLIHGRPEAIYKSKEKIPDEVKYKGMNEINQYIENYTYDELIAEMSIDKLYSFFTSCKPYKRTIAVRLLFERCEGMLKKLKKECPEACKFVNETNHIENDYIFQLNPQKYFIIPSFYLEEIEEFLKNHKKEIECLVLSEAESSSDQKSGTKMETT